MALGFGVYGEFEAAKRKLRRVAPPRYPVFVRRCPLLPNEGGDCDLRERGKFKKFLIRINNSLDETSAVLLLMHEWAHCLAWGDSPCHGKKWASAYSRVYQVIGTNGE